MKKIVYVSPDLLLSDDVIIIGSSGSLINKKRGTKIDDYDSVVRFNRAPTIGYENICGSKTSLRVMNNHVLLNVDITHNDGGYSNQPKNFAKNLNHTNILYIGADKTVWEQRFNNTGEGNNLFLFDYEQMETIKAKLGGDFSRNMTVGATFVCLCVLSGIKPALLGFDLSDKINRSHYWEKRPDKADNISHNISGEILLLRSLEKQGKIELL
jgi:hypothetical protein